MNGISLEDILYLFTGLRKTLPFRVHKLVDIFFCDTSLAPKILTCGYTVTLLIQGWEQAVNIQQNLEEVLVRFKHCIVYLIHYRLESGNQTI